MKCWKFGLPVSALAAAAAFVSCEQAGGKAAEPVIDFEDRVQATSYFLGRDIGATVKGLADETEVIDGAVVARALLEAMRGDPALVSDSVLQDIDMQFRKLVTEKRDLKKKMALDSLKKIGDDFLAANRSAPGVQVTNSGLQYIVLEEGTGESPAIVVVDSAGPPIVDTVKVHYRGTLINGTQFDSSYDRGEPTTFPLTRVIRGWTEGLQLMKTGGKIRLFVPSELAYGEGGMRQTIEPNSALIFEVELLEVIKGKPPQPQPAQRAGAKK